MIQSVDLNTIPLVEGWAESDGRLRWRGTFPFAPGELDDLAVVHFTLEPGQSLPRHTDSREELLVLVAGEVEASVGHERGRIGSVSLTRVPAMVPHGFTNIGTETARVIGIFPAAYSIATFEEVLHPFGARVLRVPPEAQPAAEAEAAAAA